MVAIYFFGFVVPNPNQKWSPEQAYQPHVEIIGDKVHEAPEGEGVGRWIRKGRLTKRAAEGGIVLQRVQNSHGRALSLAFRRD